MVFCLSTVLIPATPLNKITFVVAIAAACVMRPKAMLHSVGTTLSPILVLAVFAYGYALSLFEWSDATLSLQFLLSVSVLWFTYVVQVFRIDIERILVCCGVILATLTLTLLASLVLAPDNALTASVMPLFIDMSLGVAGEREFDSAPLTMLHFGTTPFLYLPFCALWLSLFRGATPLKLLGTIIVGSAIVLSTSRALLLVTVLAAMLIALWDSRLHWKIVQLALGIALLACALWVLSTNTDAFSVDEVSNQIKLGHLDSYNKLVTGTSLLTGSGLASFYYSTGFGEPTAHTEITLLDSLRYFGLPMTVLLYSALLLPTLRSRRRATALPTVLFVLYLLLSLTNPVLFNSAGLLIVLWYWSVRLQQCQPISQDRWAGQRL